MFCVLLLLVPLSMAVQNADPPYENILLQKPITITGKVVNQQGQPLAGVRVDYTANGTQPNA